MEYLYFIVGVLDLVDTGNKNSLVGLDTQMGQKGAAGQEEIKACGGND
jgi:hypothetical protein